MHEASLYEKNSYITLTYAPEFLPKGGSLDRRAFPLFMKRLRKEVGPVRYFHAGEYGEENGRPHYHALLFGLRFDDQRASGKSKGGFPVFRSDTLQWLWPDGFSDIGAVSFESASYVARYCLKKVTGPGAQAHYQRVGPDGELYQLEPEYATMSRGNGIPGDPGQFGIGAGWYQKYRGEVYRDDAVYARGHEVVPPRFYDKKEAERDEARMEVVKLRRIRKQGERCTIANLVTWRTNAAREAMAFAKLRELEGL